MEIANFFLKNMMHELTSPKCNSNKTTLSPSENCYNYSINRIANHATLYLIRTYLWGKPLVVLGGDQDTGDAQQL